MKLFSEVHIENAQFQISYKDKLFFIGSCFSNEMSQKFEYNGYELLANPFGTVYNSRAILNQFKWLCDDYFDINSFIAPHDDDWVSLLHNTSFRHQDQSKLMDMIAEVKKQSLSFLEQSDYCFITLGTSSVYQHFSSNRIVANNQKLAGSEFKQLDLSSEEITKDLEQIAIRLKELKPDVNIIVTISPVRHQRLGMVANQRSKARLVLAMEDFVKQSNVYYFPSYEIVLDELRDYRFYSDDLVHVNRLAADYMWDKLSTSFLNPDESHIREEVKKYRKLQQHRVVNQEKQNIHLENIEKKRKELTQQFGLKMM